MNAKRIQRMAVAVLAAPAVLFAVSSTASADTQSSFSHCHRWSSDCGGDHWGGRWDNHWGDRWDHWGDHWGDRWGNGGDHWGNGW